MLGFRKPGLSVARHSGVLALLFLAASCGSADGGNPLQDGLVAPLVGAGILSDDFHSGVLDTQLWEVVDPRGDSTVELVGAGTPDAHLLLSVPAGTKHDAWSTNTALRLMQPAADEDFEIEAKFESEPTERYQGQGLLVEQDASNYIRFDVYSDGSSLHVFSAKISNGSPSVKVNAVIASAPTIYLRLGRTGNQWTAQYSYDGSSWVTAKTFSHALAVSSVGVFASNFDPNPAYTAVVDYFLETSAPIASEDPSLCDPADQLILTTQGINGTVLREPDQGSYGCGEVVTLTAQPDVGATFVSWGGALSGTTNPAVLTIDSDTTVTANFLLDAFPPQISNINATADETSATVSWQTDELSVGWVEYGLTPSYELGSVASSTLGTAHAATLSGLSAGTLYHYRITAEDSLGNSASSADATFATGGGTGGTGGTGGSGGTAGSGGTGGTAGSSGTGGAGSGGPGAAGILSDDFHSGVLDTQLWEVVDPRGDSTVELVGAGTPDAHLLLSVPAGTKHDAWSTNTALRLMQPAADEDFEIEAKFESEPTERYQGQGLLVEQDASNYIRFDVYSDGSSLHVFSAKISNGSPSVKVNAVIASAPTIYLRLGRTGNQWTAQYSYDGSSWVTAKTFSHALAVSSVGVFASNFNPNPAYTAVVDYFFETSAPITSEDPSLCDPTDQLILTTQGINGTILRDPDQSSYGCGEVVTLSAQPDVGATFVSWGGALSGTTNPAVLTIDSDTTVTANFLLDESPPQISNINATTDETSATVSWQTDELSVGWVEYGLTPSYELGSVASSTLGTAHAVTLPGLSAGTLHHYRITAEDSLGNSASSVDATFTTTTSGGGTGGTGGTGGSGGTAGSGGTSGSGGTGGTDSGGPGAAGILSDDFHMGVLDTQLWEVVDPQGDSTVSFAGAGTSDAHLLLSVPAGTKHDAWSTNTALRLMQPAADEDFEIEAKFESEPTERYQGQGLLVEQDASNYIRFDVYSDGSSLHVFSAKISNGSPSVKVNAVIASAPTIYLRLGRAGNQWTAQYSYDGLSWVTAKTFTHTLAVWSVGVFASNFNPNPAYTAVVDYFFETSSPIVPEDGLLCDPGDQFTVATSSTGDGTILRDPDQGSYGCGEVVTLSAQPDVGATFVSWGGALSGTTNPAVLTIDSDTTVTADFVPDVFPPQISNINATANETSATVSWQTDELSVGWVEYGLTPSYELGSVASSTLGTAHAVTLPGLSAGTLHHYRITAEDSLGNSASSVDATFTTTTSGGTGGPDIDVWYGPFQVFGQAGVPQRFINVLGKVRDDDGVLSLTYSLNGGPESPLTIGSNGTRLWRSGDFNTEIAYADLPLGVSQLTLRAHDALGNESVEIVSVEYVDNVVAPLPYDIEWSSVSEVSDVAQIVDGHWSLSSEGLRTVTTGYDRLVAIGDLQWTDYEAVVEFTLNAPVSPNQAPIVGLVMRWTGHFDWNGGQPRVGWYPLGALMGYLWDGSEAGLGRFGSDGDRSLLPGSAPEPIVGVPYLFKMRGEALTGSDVQYSLKMWRAGQPEPSQWGITYITNGAPAGGSLLLLAHQLDVTFGNVAIVPVGY